MPLGMSTLDSVQGPQIYLGSLSAWLQTKTPMPQAWLPWLQSRGPRDIQGLKCLVLDQDSHAPGMVTLVAIQGPWLLTQGLQLLGPRPRLSCPRHGYPGCNPGALEISRVFKCLVPDQDSHAPGMVTLVAIQGPWLLTQGLQLLGYEPSLPCTRHGYPGYKPGALVTNLGSSTAWLRTKTSMHQAWVPWLQTRGPGY